MEILHKDALHKGCDNNGNLTLVTNFSMFADLIICNKCRRQFVIKQTLTGYRGIFPIVANELLAYRLIDLLRSKGVVCDVAGVQLYRAPTFQNNLPFVLMEYLGQHYRVTSSNIETVPSIILPTWLYWFDVWTHRLDACGDSNLLRVGDRVVPIDFNLCFTWANFHYYTKIDDININHHSRIIDIADENVRRIIKALTDEEIWDAIFGDGAIMGCIDVNLLTAYYTGLIMRRDLL